MKYKFLVVIISLSLFTTACSNASDQEVLEILTPVEVTKAYMSSISNDLSYAGKVNPSESINVFSKLSGKALSTYFEVGDFVNAGAIMVTLDQQAILDQIKNLESQIAIANQSILSAENSISSVTGAQFENQIQQLENAITNASKQVESAELAKTNAQLALDNSQTTYDNNKILFDAGLVSKNDFDRIELALNQSRSSYEQSILAHNQASDSLINAQNSLALNKGTIVEENVEKATLALNQTKASKNATQVQLDIARNSLNDTSVIAPISGTVSSKNIKVSEFASPQLPTYTIINTNTVNVEVNVSELLINQISIGQPVDVYVSSVKNESFLGKIIEISPVADQSSTYPIKIELENNNNLLKPGMFAEASFAKDFSNTSIVVPRNTVLNDENTEYVYIVVDDVATKIDVTTGIDSGASIEILTGLNVGDQIITKGQTYVTNGQKLNVVSGGN
jgi:RND family efflux transporter MFP subunit